MNAGDLVYVRVKVIFTDEKVVRVQLPDGQLVSTLPHNLLPPESLGLPAEHPEPALKPWNTAKVGDLSSPEALGVPTGRKRQSDFYARIDCGGRVFERAACGNYRRTA